MNNMVRSGETNRRHAIGRSMNSQAKSCSGTDVNTCCSLKQDSVEIISLALRDTYSNSVHSLKFCDGSSVRPRLFV